jgi:hypothetical protein
MDVWTNHIQLCGIDDHNMEASKGQVVEFESQI